MKNARWEKIKKARDIKYSWGDDSTAVYSKYCNKLLGALIVKGNKLQALKRTRELFIEIKSKDDMEAYKILYISLLKIAPIIHAQFRKIAGRLQPIPRGLMFENKRVTYSIKWAVKGLRDRNKTRNISMKQLADLLCQSVVNKGDIIAHKNKWQQLALHNRDKTTFLGIRTKRN